MRARRRGAGSSERPLRIALLGTRGVPATYGGFETAVEEIGRRLAGRGHHVTVYGRPGQGESYLGMHLVGVPAVRHKAAETLSRTAAGMTHLLAHRRPDAVIVFNAANSPFLPLLRARGVPVATHVDGLEWQRAKWGGAGRGYYRSAEALSVRWSDALIADAGGIRDYYRDQFGVGSELIAYGAPILHDPDSDLLVPLGLTPGAYHLVVARFEPENHVLEAVRGYRESAARHPLVVVGAAPYASDYTAQIEREAAGDPRIHLLGSVWDQRQLDQLYAHPATYVHGHSVGGTNPSLLRAMGAGSPVIAFDVVFNREVLGSDGHFFSGFGDLPDRLEWAEKNADDAALRGHRLRERAEQLYRWDDTTDRYEELCRRLAAGVSQRGSATGRRLSTEG